MDKAFWDKQDELTNKLHEVNEKPKSDIQIPEFKKKEKKQNPYGNYYKYHKKPS